LAKRALKAGSTDQTIDVFIPDSASTTGGGKTGLVYNSAGLTCYYRKGATGSATALTLATQTVGGAHSDGGFVEVDATNMPGVYRLDLSDTIVASAGMVTLLLKGATGMAPVPIELEVVSYDPFDATRLGLSALPNAAAAASGGLPTVGTGTGQVNPSSGKVPATIAAGDIANGAITAASIATDAITAAKIASNAITAAKIAADAIGASQLAADAVTEIQSGLATSANVTTITGHLTDIKGATFNGTTDSLEAIRDRGDSAWTTATGFSTHSAADVWAVGTRTITGGTITTYTGNTPQTGDAYARLGAPAGASIAADVAAVKAETAAILDDTGTSGVVVASGSKTGYSLAAAGLDSIVIETGLNARQALAIIAASAAGTLAGAATTTITIDGAGVAIDRIVATVDADGNRTAVILTPPA
jgi:hypothetical protein